MICHKRKLIFIHIPKCAGSSVKNFYFNGKDLNWKTPNYEVLYGYCPERRIHLQHATARQLIETGLVDLSQWRSYFKFTIVRNPWDRTYSDYLWMINDTKINGTFEEYLTKSGPYKEVLNNSDKMACRGDHLLPQTDFFDFEGEFKLDFVARFENLHYDLLKLNMMINFPYVLNEHAKKNLHRESHYSEYYSEDKRKMVDEVFKIDIDKLGYVYEERKRSA